MKRLLALCALLATKTTYTFALYSVAKGQPRCEEGASGGIQETAFAPKSKKTNKRGNLNAKQRSKTFKVDKARRYFVLVSDGAQPVACAKLNGKKAKRGCKPPAKPPAKPHGEKPKKPKRGAHAAKRGCHKRSTRGNGGTRR